MLLHCWCCRSLCPCAGGALSQYVPLPPSLWCGCAALVVTRIMTLEAVTSFPRVVWCVSATCPEMPCHGSCRHCCRMCDGKLPRMSNICESHVECDTSRSNPSDCWHANIAATIPPSKSRLVRLAAWDPGSRKSHTYLITCMLTYINAYI